MLYIFIGWIACSFLAWGLECAAHAKACYNWLPFDWYQNLWLTLFGPIGLVVILIVDGYHGFRLIPYSKEDSWQEWIKRGWGSEPKDRQEFEDWWEKGS